jgi:transcriptional regulator with XRE-family HTH domain
MTTTKKSGTPAPSRKVRIRRLGVRRLRLRYAKRSLTRKELANLADVGTSQIEYLERRHVAPRSIETLVRIALALGVSPLDFIDHDDRQDLEAQTEERRKALGLVPRYRLSTT